MSDLEISSGPLRSYTEDDWVYLSKLLSRLRLILKRRALWLRSQWLEDPLQSYQGLVISDSKADWLLAGEDRSLEKRYYSEDKVASEITRALSKLDEELVRDRTSSEVMPSLERVVRLFNLTDFERDALVLCLAPEVDPSFERIFAYVEDDATRRYATSHLALSLFDKRGGSPEARFSLSSDGTLRRFGLTALEEGTVPAGTRSLMPLRINERVTDYLLGMRFLDEKAAELLQAIRPVPLPDSHKAIIDRLESYMRLEAENGSSLCLNLIGPGGSGKLAVAAALCGRLGLGLFKLDYRSIPEPADERREILRCLEREAVLFQAALYVEIGDGDPGLGDGAGDIRHISQLIDRLQTPLIVGSRVRWRSGREMIPINIPKPDARARHLIWQEVMPGLDGALEPIAQQFEFGPQAIVEAAAGARIRSRVNGSFSSDLESLWQACREQSAWEVDGLAQLIEPKATWDDIVLPEEAFKQLKEIADQLSNRPKVYDEWGFGRKLSRGRSITALFSGPSGAGKTMAAEILANHLELGLYRIDLAGVVSKYIGETEKNLRKVFEAAEMSGAILFFDEADALFGKRTEVKDSHDRYANIEVNYLLQKMEDYRGLAILATNRKAFLDNAFLRRIRFIVDMPSPSAVSRKSIWQKVFPKEASLDGLNYDALSRLEITGGNIKNIALNAAFLAAEEGKPISMNHIMCSAKREYAKIDKLLSEAEFGQYYKLVKS
jgi:ATP-dependent 26S proteasome regulatory subunit